MSGFDLGIRRFRTKELARTEIRRILHSAELDAPLTGPDHTLIAALHARHPRRSGIADTFAVGTNDYYGAKTRGFRAIYASGLVECFSYMPCLNPATDVPKLLGAMRAAIIPSQRDVLRGAYAGRAFLACRHCQLPVQLDAAHVHHLAPKFRDIAEHFISLLGMPVVVTAALGDEFAEPDIRRRWVLFHDAIAQRVVLCAKCNAEDERAENSVV